MNTSSHMKYCPILLILACAFTIISCKGKRYIKEVPYHYSSDEYLKAKEIERKKAMSDTRIVDDNPEGLNDDTLRIKEKYSIIMEVMPKEVRDYHLYAYIDNWIGTPYKHQALEIKKGVDCSYFVQALYSDVYGASFSKTPDGIYRSKAIQLFTGRAFLQEGDILFFRYDKDHPLSDVGIYLHNDRIVACTEKGLNIYNFNDPYFQLRYVAAGRLLKLKK